ncbi:hypothetical protein [Scleromatobacter humisilvae]|uniref:Uncharacterized protein n=1 Tax=Scleromatobacter humisilvae TaxID=2897159 RepID=A0A9X2C362_9BURK|nr:hypothetical protein [Scleromatobacter humisilvae]MCK9686900.1 hypothetical protein [Scleromatobacter humisilvae]
MPMVTPSLNLPQPAATTSSAPKTAAAPLPPIAPPVSNAAQAKMPDAPSTTVTLSPQAMSAMAASSHPSSSPMSNASAPAPAPAAQDGSLYDSIKMGISTAVADVGDAIADGAHAVVDGVETTLSTANKVATGIVELPFAAVSKAADAVGALIDKL